MTRMNMDSTSQECCDWFRTITTKYWHCSTSRNSTRWSHKRGNLHFLLAWRILDFMVLVLVLQATSSAAVRHLMVSVIVSRCSRLTSDREKILLSVHMLQHCMQLPILRIVLKLAWRCYQASITLWPHHSPWKYECQSGGGLQILACMSWKVWCRKDE